MAKADSLIIFSGTIGGLTFVRSNRYGNHVRAKRGTKSPAPVNAAFKAASEVLNKATFYAKLIKDSLDKHRGEQYDGTLWSRLIKFFCERLKESDIIDFSKLKSFRISRMHLSGVTNLSTTLRSHQNLISIQLGYSIPFFARMPKTTAYELSVIVLFVSERQKLISDSVACVRKPISRDSHAEHTFAFEMPHDALIAIVVVKFHALIGNTPSGNRAGLAMSVADVVKLSELRTPENTIL